MKYVLLFEDNEELSSVRSKFMEQHLEFLEKNSDRIMSAGPMRDAETRQTAGGMWIVENNELMTIQSLIKEDPFWPTGLRKSIRILEWKQVFNDGSRQINL